MREANHKMTLRELVPYMDFACNVKIVQMDAYIDREKEEEIFDGIPFDIPWWVADMYLHVNENGEAIYNNKNANYITIYVVENPDNTDGGR
jgi:hypothetical protein